MEPQHALVPLAAKIVDMFLLNFAQNANVQTTLQAKNAENAAHHL